MKRTFTSVSPRPSKRSKTGFSTEYEPTHDVVTAPNKQKDAEFLLRLISENLIQRHCSARNFGLGKEMVGDVSDLLSCDAGHNQFDNTIRLSGVVNARMNIFINLRKNDEGLPSANIISASCSCGEVQQSNTLFCSHVIAVLCSVCINGTRTVEFHQSITSIIASKTQEELVECITSMVRIRPDMVPLIKKMLLPCHENKEYRTVIPSSCARKSISSGKRKAIVSASVLGDLTADVYATEKRIETSFDSFMASYAEKCDSFCICLCHSSSMVDGNECYCNGHDGDYSILKSAIVVTIQSIEEDLSFKQQESASNALLTSMALIRSFGTHIKKMALTNEGSSGGSIAINFPWHQSHKMYAIHKDHLLRNARELIWKFAVLLVRDDIFYEVRAEVGQMIQKWLDLDCPLELKPLLEQLHFAAFDSSLGMTDSFALHPLIVAARAFEYFRRNDEPGLVDYWVRSDLPHTAAEFVRSGHDFSSLLAYMPPAPS